MLSEKEKAEFDQNAAFLADSLPSQWRGLYNQCVVDGFNELRAFQLVQTYILFFCPGGVRGPE